MTRRPLALAAAAALAAGLAGPVLATTSAAPAAASPPAGQDDTIVHLFEWSWRSIASECTSTLGPKGYGAVQVSPPQEHIVLPDKGYPWWQDYQPISYKLVTRRGDRAAFASMVSTCHAAGVKVYVDAVLNHMQGAGQSGTGSAGSSFSDENDPGVPYSSSDFHSPCAIQSWTDRSQVQGCQLSNLTDLKTESSYVRGKEDGYLNDLISLGVDGFRLDAAKHIPEADISAIESGLSKQVYVYQEVIEGGQGEISPTEYTPTGDVTEFRYGDTVGNAFRGGNLSGLQGLPSQMLLASDKAQVFIDNHDTERNGRTKLNYTNGDRYYLAEGFMLAYPFGTPSVMSGYAFSNPDQGPPATSDGTTTAAVCGSGTWTCQHRDPRIAGMVGFRNATRGAAVTDWWSNGGSQIAFGRGSSGYVVFNTDGSSLTRTFQTSLPAGTYCDLMTGQLSGSSCTGGTVTVASGGTFTATVGANRDLAIDTAQRVGTTTSPTPTPTPTPTSSTGTVQATFSVNATTTYGQGVYVVGSIPALGSWDPSKAVALSSAAYPVWRGSVTLPAGTPFQYKYVKKDASGTVTWETTGNRSVTTPASGSVGFSDSWSTTTSPTPTPSASATAGAVSATFAEYATTTYGQGVYVVGSIPALGSWDPSRAVALSSAAYPTWRATVTLPGGTSFEYKYVKKNPDGSVVWESGSNRTQTTPASGSASWSDSWR
ncbi:alpha-amylase [Motilibacter rhizosphaerae]|uniref:Alpha-amylase n=1 Tax=Motilibacter rhizosphaerae TaxID=598652 RepID=A0A4Q7NQ44_9ACTN|nr:carbohydrate-binding module family 20 domain-containing protein [Motilibacter rhizosphaerae]RZS87232.1 alpha-amylase [Motilibacter rhizosphaerae]